MLSQQAACVRASPMPKSQKKPGALRRDRRARAWVSARRERPACGSDHPTHTNGCVIHPNTSLARRIQATTCIVCKKTDPAGRATAAAPMPNSALTHPGHMHFACEHALAGTPRCDAVATVAGRPTPVRSRRLDGGNVLMHV